MFKECPLGQKTTYIENYDPTILYPIPRTLARNKTGIKEPLPFSGIDIWNGYELSWLSPKGKPQIAMAEFIFPYNSPNVIESKSFKLYLNSFNQTPIESFEAAQKIMEKDLTAAAGSPVRVHLFPPKAFKDKTFCDFEGTCLDDLDVYVDTYEVNPEFLKINPQNIVEEKLYSDLLKSNCLATGQPDWGSVYIHYTGPKIDSEGLLQYIISFRRHSGFAEHCIEQMYNDILQYCSPHKLTVYGRYTRRGGLDINPFRSNFDRNFFNKRQTRQ